MPTLPHRGSRRRSTALLAATPLLLALLACPPSPPLDPDPMTSTRTPQHDADETATPSAHRPAANRLAHESSPYLLQHAHNPVDWYPWGDEALRRAKEENKPIFLSIGYSACHWCHVMERESFENPAIAKLLNESFISIKVDREERPDLDEIYMTAVQMMTGSGGWPLTVFLTPDLEPFFGGTYFPPEDHYGRPGFGRLLNSISDAWTKGESELQDQAQRLTKAIRNGSRFGANPGAGMVDENAVSLAVAELGRTFDAEWGGFGLAPKFPPNGAIGILMREHARTGDARALLLATTTLDRMAEGGMYDQLGGGFHRYSTDEKWLVPHFEKMLYDNALLTRVYLEGWQLTGKESYRRVARETLDYVLRDLADPLGGFHSSEDADSEGEEGIFYIWSLEELERILGAQDTALVAEVYGVKPGGNFEGRSILHLARDVEVVAKERGIELAVLETRLLRARSLLLAAREQRIRPGKDDKILASWNGMMISAFARGYQVLRDPRYLAAAENAARFLLDTMRHEGRLARSFRGGHAESVERSRHRPGYLDDYAEVANACVDLYETTFDPAWLTSAEELTERMIADFGDEEGGGFFFTSDDHRDLLVRTKPFVDGAVPAGNSTACLVLARLSELLGRPEYRERAERILATTGETVGDHPGAFHNLLHAVEFLLRPTHEIALVGEIGGAETRAFLAEIHGRFLPHKILAAIDPDATDAEATRKRIPLLAGKEPIDGHPAAYLCENYACQEPVTNPAALRALLNGDS